MAKIRDISVNNPLLALKNRNFRLYWLGMCVSLAGTWMQNTAQPWLAYSLTDSPFLLSLTGVMQFTPLIFLSLPAGVLIDRIPKKRILLITQSSSLAVTLCLALLVWTGQVRYWHILVASAALGVVNTLDMPARQSFVVEMVGKEDLGGAIALNSMAFNLARVFGPALAGVVMTLYGTAMCFYVNSFSFAAVLLVLAFIHPAYSPPPPAERRGVREEIMEGLRYIRRKPYLIRVMGGIFVTLLFAGNYNVLVPVLAKTVLGMGESGFGILLSCLGVGSFFGAAFVASGSRQGPREYILRRFPYLVAALLLLTGLSRQFVPAALCLAGMGFFLVSYTSTANAAVQYRTEDRYRGRVMSVYVLVFCGCAPLGNLVSGAVAEHLGASAAYWICGAGILAMSLPLRMLQGKAGKE
ncbi:MFS transporter [Papillibacter cinnamivorans]|uniref:Predicted arabinose efflux permease, MFS family n=1 Tax=Papillibacter cinnamivorans DSM 12816 TaxID=1122930 RepID=A0A1W2C648_9FIRM|nr:MFS transporter [Papillibacter cinnamivorans]SMC80586.1 Predicted arabinose efflux permease, MFS family [Papillibacter cinnamivorans DSM 12816]